MTGKNDDPFERLSQITAPQPDRAKIDAVTAMSVRAFSAQLAQAPEKRKSRLRGWIKETNWLLPASAMAFTVLVAALIVPLIGGQGRVSPSPSDTMLSREPTAVAEAEPPLLDGEPATPAPEEGIRMGAAPSGPPGSSLPLDLRDDVAIQNFTFDDLEIVMRSAEDEVALYTLQGTVEHQFDQRFKEPSETIVLTDAFRQNVPEGTVLFVRSGTEGGQHQWDAYIDIGAGYVVSGALSSLVHDATDRDDVLARLNNAERQ